MQDTNQEQPRQTATKPRKQAITNKSPTKILSELISDNPNLFLDFDKLDKIFKIQGKYYQKGSSKRIPSVIEGAIISPCVVKFAKAGIEVSFKRKYLADKLLGWDFSVQNAQEETNQEYTEQERPDMQDFMKAGFVLIVVLFLTFLTGMEVGKL